ncbi:hypothetical protein R5W24_000821 [Gemmata sp. JC717]|uniref:DUF4760 domain-containing protein n=1 Tax=Gemmata algarum TaxID=2975278 RepID=A0ABU5F4M5_9BACT|nr:hypothetical protein [Gemmata algarum]MDY3551742.1 hypothetical protein [Gemmata algarum]MDY3561707.1 hypothetical protein [Gemmata algarum]
MNHRTRQFFFRHYWWLAFGCAGLVICGVHGANVEKRWEMTAAIIGVIASVIYFVQKQKLEETQLFERLFVRFNEQYSRLHEQLQQICRQDGEEILLSAQQAETLDKYFNLCAEEFLFYSEGRILTKAWSAWCRGMLIYLQNPIIARWWQQQETTNSHYGLTRAEIERGAIKLT